MSLEENIQFRTQGSIPKWELLVIMQAIRTFETMLNEGEEELRPDLQYCGATERQVVLMNSATHLVTYNYIKKDGRFFFGV